MGELPVSTLADEIETPGEGQVRALVTIAGNPALTTPDAARLEALLAGLELMVCVDPYLNATTRHAHVILPPPSLLREVALRPRVHRPGGAGLRRLLAAGLRA